FSSRRRHTRSLRDWSSDVCSSDLAMLIPSAVLEADSTAATAFTQKLSVGLSVLLVLAYAMGLVFSLKTHREIFAGAGQVEAGERSEEHTSELQSRRDLVCRLLLEK